MLKTKRGNVEEKEGSTSNRDNEKSSDSKGRGYEGSSGQWKKEARSEKGSPHLRKRGDQGRGNDNSHRGQ